MHTVAQRLLQGRIGALAGGDELAAPSAAAAEASWVAARFQAWHWAVMRKEPAALPGCSPLHGAGVLAEHGEPDQELDSGLGFVS